MHWHMRGDRPGHSHHKAMLTSGSTQPRSPLNPLKTWSHSLPGIPEELQLKHYQTTWTLVRQQEGGLFEGLSPPGDSQRGFLTSGMSLENTIKDMYKHTESKHPFDREGSFHYLGNFAHSLGKPPTLLLVILALSWNMSTASASYLHFFTVNCAAELPGSSVGSGEDALPKQSSTLGWMVGSWRETEIGAKLPEGHNANQSFLFHAAGRTKGARSTGLLVVKIALQG